MSGERYNMSFTTGGLFRSESLALARMFLSLGEWAAVRQKVGVHFTWEFDNSGTLHARHIVTDHGWKISLDRGLDIFQHYEMNDAFSFTNRLQQSRSCKAFEVTFIHQKPGDKL